MELVVAVVNDRLKRDDVPMKAKMCYQSLARASAMAVLVALAACGGSGSSIPPNTNEVPAPINTFVYVDTACRDSADGFSMTQELRVLRGENGPLTIARIPMVGPLQVPVTYCGDLALPRSAPLFLAFGGFQRLAMSPVATVIVFEVTDDFSILGQSFVPAEQKGIFRIRPDGSGLRRLGNPSRVPAISTGFGRSESNFYFSPSGRLVSFTDIGPGPGGEDAVQVFVLDVETGKRTQLTHMPPAARPGLDGGGADDFLNERTVVFDGIFNPDGLNPDGKERVFTVDVVTRQIKVESTVAIPGGGFVAVPSITGFGRVTFPAMVPGTPVNKQAGENVFELFITDGTNLLQLTNFGRSDTSPGVPFVSIDGAHAFFVASADPDQMNPSELCQIFSVDALGGDVRQLTRFSASQRSALGCVAFGRASEGCTTEFNDSQRVSQDARSGTVVFGSSCDPFGTNQNGVQIFAIRPDGSGLHALTDARGLVRNTDRSVEAELPGPWSYGPHR